MIGQRPALSGWLSRFSAALLLWICLSTGPLLAQAALTDLLAPEAPQEEQAAAAEEQSGGSGEEGATTPVGEIDRQLWQANPQAIDYDAWEDHANRTEQLLLRDQAQPFVLERIRSEIGDWRDTFADAMSENEERLITVENQIAALGPAPADGASEAEMIAERRKELIAKRDLLAVPGLLATEAHARATGLIREAEVQLTERETEDLLNRHPSPLNPASWTGAVSTLWTGLTAVAGETTSGMARVTAVPNTAILVVIAILSICVGIWLFVRGRWFAQQIFGAREGDVGRLLFGFLRTAAEAAFPLLGLVALIFGLSELDIFGPLGEDILRTIPVTGSVIILSGWLARQFFPQEPNRYGPLGLDEDVRVASRRAALTLAWVSGLWIPYGAFLQGTQADASVSAVLNFPVIVVISIVLFRFATLLRAAPSEDAGPNVSQGRTRALIGRLAQAVAIVSPLLSALGYDAAADALLFPTILTLGVVGVLVYLQSLAHQTYELVAGDQDNRPYALAPVVIGLILLMLSAPILALIWGAQRADLIEYWTRFTEGFTFGDTTISPVDFFWFVVIFSLGYLLTQFIKNTLRSSVLPRTRLDLGAQNAVVAGFGYVGIFLAAIVAITSAGLDLSNLAIVAGALSVGIGFGLQTIVSNFVSGIILLIERPISEGDWIEVDGKMGHVRDISVRSTRIETFDQTDVIVPNADLVSNQVINWTRGNLVGRLILPVGVAYGSDVDEVMEILKDVAENHPMVIMSPPPGILFMNFGADALEFEIRAILRDVHFLLVTRSEMNAELSRRFAEAGIEIPFAQRDIWLRNPEVLGHAQKDEAPKDNGQSDGTSPESSSEPQHRDAPEDPDADADGETT